MHEEAREFVKSIKLQYPKYFVETRVLELGSLNINGTIRDLFENCYYIGVDTQSGPGVDVVCLAHEAPFEENYFDTVISTEMLEHDPYKEQSIAKAVKLLRKDGLLIITCASKKRLKHGTKGPDGHYEGIERSELKAYLKDCQKVKIGGNHNPGDIHIIAIK